MNPKGFIFVYQYTLSISLRTYIASEPLYPCKHYILLCANHWVSLTQWHRDPPMALSPAKHLHKQHRTDQVYPAYDSFQYCTTFSRYFSVPLQKRAVLFSVEHLSDGTILPGALRDGLMPSVNFLLLQPTKPVL